MSLNEAENTPRVVQSAQAEFIARRDCINCASSSMEELSRGRFVDEPLAGFLRSDPGGDATMFHLQEAEWSFVRCLSCGQRFHRLVLSDAWDEKRFSEWMTAEGIRDFEEMTGATRPASKYRSAVAHVGHVVRIEQLTRGLRDESEPVRLLDFGCGWGGFLSACLLFGFDAVGVDRATPRAEGSIVPILRNLDELDPARHFHAITLFEVLEHLKEPSAVLRLLAERLLPGGILILETPDCAGVFSIKSLDEYRKIHPLEHVNAFTHETLTSIAGRHGFQPIRRGPVHVTASRQRVFKTEIKHALQRDRRSTQMYFRKRR
jgi:2-polyprenyl-3-methyl-5-hydroxy-6-metoxy-1,4-benzoquinol methylase